MISISLISLVRKVGENMKIGVIGLSYIELSTASLFPQSRKIVGVDNNKKNYNFPKMMNMFIKLLN